VNLFKNSYFWSGGPRISANDRLCEGDFLPFGLTYVFSQSDFRRLTLPCLPGKQTATGNDTD